MWILEADCINVANLRRVPLQRGDMALLFFPHCGFEIRSGKNPRRSSLCFGF